MGVHRHSHTMATEYECKVDVNWISLAQRRYNDVRTHNHWRDMRNENRLSNGQTSDHGMSRSSIDHRRRKKNSTYENYERGAIRWTLKKSKYQKGMWLRRSVRATKDDVTRQARVELELPNSKVADRFRFHFTSRRGEATATLANGSITDASINHRIASAEPFSEYYNYMRIAWRRQCRLNVTIFNNVITNKLIAHCR